MSGHLARNLAIDMGQCAVLRSGNVQVVVTSRSGPHFAPELFRAAGIDPFAASVLIAKSPCGFRAAYAERAVEIMMVRAPGVRRPISGTMIIASDRIRCGRGTKLRNGHQARKSL